MNGQKTCTTRVVHPLTTATRNSKTPWNLNGEASAKSNYNETHPLALVNYRTKKRMCTRERFLYLFTSTKNPLLPSSETRITFPMHISCKPTTMEDSIQQDLIEKGRDDKLYCPTEDDIDESRFVYILNAILSGTARLNVLLPSATILAFTIFTPLLTNNGKCDTMNRWLMGFFSVISAASCVFLSITDSFRTATGRLHYGVATFRGIWTFNGGRKTPLMPPDYKLRWSDLFHSSLSLTAFLTFATLHRDVVGCYYPQMPRKVINAVPLAVGFVISVLFVMFPPRRRGIGYPFLLQRDALYSRN